MRWAGRLSLGLALRLGLASTSPKDEAVAIEQGKLVAPGHLVLAGRKLACGATATLIRDFEGFAVSTTVIMLNMREGWLDREGLEDICTTFNIAGHGPVHPDPKVRCRQLRRCFDTSAAATPPP